jgi:hypothetical protein
LEERKRNMNVSYGLGKFVGSRKEGVIKLILYFGILLVLVAACCFYDVITFGGPYAFTSMREHGMDAYVCVQLNSQGTYLCDLPGNKPQQQSLYIGPNHDVSRAINVPQYILLLLVGVRCIVASLRKDWKMAGGAFAVLALLALFHYTYVPTVYEHLDDTLSLSR